MYSKHFIGWRFIDFFCLFWRFDVEKECAKVEGCNKEKSSPGLINHGLPKIKRKIDTTGKKNKIKWLHIRNVKHTRYYRTVSEFQFIFKSTSKYL